MTDWNAGLTSDDLSGFPSAASPLASMGIDPDELQKNPDLLARLTNRNPNPPAPNPPVNRSAVAAGATGGAGDTSTPPVTPATTAPVPTDPHGYALAGLGGLEEARKKATIAAGEIPTETPPEVTRLQAQEEKLQPKTPLRDAQGNMLPQYKPSTGQRVWRGVRGGLVGFLTGGIPGAAVGALEPGDIRGGTAYGAPNKTYERAEQSRTQQLGATETNLEQARKNWEEAVKAQQAKAQEFGKVAALGKDETTGATGLITAENKPETEENKTKAKLDLTDKEFTQRSGQADRLGLKGTQRSLYITNGKLPDPRQPTEGELALSAATQAFVRQNGRQPNTVEEMNQIAGAAKGTLGKGDDEDKQKAANLRTAVRSAERHLKDLQDMQKHAYMLPPEGKTDLEKKIKDAQDEYDDLQSQLTGKEKPPPLPPVTMNQTRGGSTGIVPAAPVPAKAPTTALAAPAAAPPTASKIDPKNLPKQVMVKGKLRNVVGYNEQTKKVVVAPEGQ